MVQIILIFLVLLLHNSYAGKLPPEFKTCKRDDSNLSVCLKNAIEDALVKLDNGIPSLNVPPLQPFTIPSLTVEGGEAAIRVAQHFTNFSIYNMGTSKIEELDFNVTSDSLKLKSNLYAPMIVKVEAGYSINGRAFWLPIVGNGTCTVELDQLKTALAVNAETFKKEGKKYLRVKDFILKLYPGKIVFDYKNLFKGNVQLASRMKKLLNENWKDVFDELGGSFEKAMQISFADYVNKIFTKIPYDDLM